MREKKLDLEEAIQEEKKTIDTLKKEVDALIKKNKIINHGVKGAKWDNFHIQSFWSFGLFHFIKTLMRAFSDFWGLCFSDI